MRYLLNLLYASLLVAALPWLVSRRCAPASIAQGWAAKLLGLVPTHLRRPTVRLVSRGQRGRSESDCASVLAEIAAAQPDVECVISTTTPPATSWRNEVRRANRSSTARWISVGPFGRRMRRIRPQLLILAELELWPNLIRGAARAGARGRRRQRPAERSQLSRLLGASGRWSRRLLATDRPGRRAERANTPIDFGVLGAAATSPCHVTGSIKFDGAATDRDNPRTTAPGMRWPACRPTTSCSWPAARRSPRSNWRWTPIRRLSPAIPSLRLILVPRHPERFDDVARLLRGQRHCPGSAAAELDAAGGRPARAQCCLVDAVGELGGLVGNGTHRLTSAAAWATRRGQNMIEPAAYGAAVSLRPQHAKLPRRGGGAPGGRCRGRRARWSRADRVRPPLPGRARLSPIDLEPAATAPGRRRNWVPRPRTVDLA